MSTGRMYIALFGSTGIFVGVGIIVPMYDFGRDWKLPDK